MTEIIPIVIDLPLDIVKLIDSYLEVKYFWRFCLTCKSFSRVCFDAIYVDWKLGSFLKKLVPPKILESGRLIDAYRKFKKFEPDTIIGCFKVDSLGNKLFLCPYYDNGWQLYYTTPRDRKFSMMVTKNYLQLDLVVGYNAVKPDNLYELFDKKFHLSKINEFRYLSSFFQRLWEEIENRGPERLKDKYRDTFRMLIQGSLETSHDI